MHFVQVVKQLNHHVAYPDTQTLRSSSYLIKCLLLP